MSESLSRRTERTLFRATAGIILLAHAVFQISHLGDPPSGLTPAKQWSVSALALLLVAWLLLRWNRKTACYVVVSFLLLDLAAGGVSHVFRARLHGSLLPSNEEWPWVYHRLLDAANKPNASGEGGTPRIRWRHDKYGYRRDSAPDFTRPTAIVLGGSSTYDLAVSNGQTWVDVLRKSDRSVDLINAGVPGYGSVQHVIQTAFYLPRSPALVCAVYYLGWNDISKSYLPTNDAALADIPRFDAPWPPYDLTVPLGSPVLSLVLRLIFRPLIRVQTIGVHHGIDAHLRELFVRNAATILAINKANGIRSVFIGQVLNNEALKGSGTELAMVTVPDSEAPRIVADFNRALAETVVRNGGTYVRVSPDAFSSADFKDTGHFVARGSAKFAQLVRKGIHDGCFAPAPGIAGASR